MWCLPENDPTASPPRVQLLPDSAHPEIAQHLALHTALICRRAAASRIRGLFQQKLDAFRRKCMIRIRNMSSRPTTKTTGPALTTDLTVNIGSFTCAIEAADTNDLAKLTAVDGCLYPLSKRPNPDTSECRKIVDVAIKVSLPKFPRTSTSLDNISSLQSVNDLHNQVTQFAAHREIEDGARKVCRKSDNG